MGLKIPHLPPLRVHRVKRCARHHSEGPCQISYKINKSLNSLSPMKSPLQAHHPRHGIFVQGVCLSQVDWRQGVGSHHLVQVQKPILIPCKGLHWILDLELGYTLGQYQKPKSPWHVGLCSIAQLVLSRKPIMGDSKACKKVASAHARARTHTHTHVKPKLVIHSSCIQHSSTHSYSLFMSQ